MTKMMVTWLGDDEGHYVINTDRDGNEYKQPVPGPSFNYWGSIRFDKDKPTLVDSEAPGMDAEKKMLVDNIIKRAPNMKGRFKTEPVPEKPSKG
jgi:hypothetical protein